MDGMTYFGIGIIDKDGNPNPNAFNSIDAATDHFEWVRKAIPHAAPYRIVELFYKEQS